MNINEDDEIEQAIQDTMDSMFPKKPGRPQSVYGKKQRAVFTLSGAAVGKISKLAKLRYGVTEGMMSRCLEEIIEGYYEADYQRRINDGEPVIED